MALKSRGRGGGGAKKGARSAPQPQEQQQAASALELVAFEEASAKPTSAKRLRRRKTEEAVAKSLKDNFPGWDSVQTDHCIVGGKSLREALTEDRRRHQEGQQGAPTMGKRYYDEMRNKFSSTTCPHKMLKVANEAEPIHPELEKGLAGLNLHVKRFDVIIDFLERGPMVNQLSLVVLLKHALKIFPQAGRESTDFLLAVLSYISKHRVHELFKQEWSHVRDHLDEALCKSWARFKSSGLPQKLWWQGV